MNLKLTPEMRIALARSPGQPIEVQDDQSAQVYYLVDDQRGKELMRRWLYDELQFGLDDVACGRVAAFDVEAIKAEGRRRRDGGT